MKKTILFILAFVFVSAVKIHAAQVDTVVVFSKANDMEIKTIVLIPDVALGDNAQNCPVVYLLHGVGGNQRDWLNIKNNLPQIADEKGIIIVCPDGKNSWYLDSPLNPKNQYETFISFELVEYIDTNYNTLADRSYRAITGLSMGGHGALYNAFKNKDVFGAVGAMSGAIDILGGGDNYGLVNLLETMRGDVRHWGTHSVIVNAMNTLKNNELAIIFDCGIDDFCFFHNETLHNVLIQKKIEHDYIVRPGEHNAAYWNNALDYQLLYFWKFFNKK
jgi:S-formylglutathione hydrolase FrmB